MDDSNTIEIGVPTSADILECVRIENIESEQIRKELVVELGVCLQQGSIRVARQKGQVVGYLDFEKTALGTYPRYCYVIL
jgi:hypothetical protein